jgi:MFS family permease
VSNDDVTTKKLPVAVVLLGLVSFFTDVSSEMIVPLLPAFITGVLGGSATFVGVVEGTADAVSSLVKMWSGRASDRAHTRKPLVLVGYGISMLMRPLVALASMPAHVVLVRSLDRVGKGIRSAPRDALIADNAGKELAGRAFGLHRSFDHAGALVGSLVATGLLALGLSVRNVFWCTYVPGAIAWLVLLAVREPKTGPRVRDDVKPKEKPEPLPRPLWRLLVIIGLFTLGCGTESFLLVRARELGVVDALLPIVWVVLHIAKSTFAAWAGRWADRWPRMWVAGAAWLCVAVGLLALGFVTTPWLVWPLVLVVGVGHGAREPAEKVMVHDLSTATARGGAFGAYNLVIGLGALPAGFLIGALWESEGSMIALSVQASAALLAVAALLLNAQNRLPRDDVKAA